MLSLMPQLLRLVGLHDLGDTKSVVEMVICTNRGGTASAVGTVLFEEFAMEGQVAFEYLF